MIERIYDSKGTLTWEIIYPEKPKPKKVSEAVTSKDPLPYGDLRVGEPIIHGYIARTDRKKHRQIVEDERRRAQWERRKA